MRLRREAWIDDPPSLVLQPKHLDALRSLGLTGVAVMVDTWKPGLDLRWRERDLERLAEALPDMDRTVTCWAEPEPGSVAALSKGLPPLVRAFGAEAVECDLEMAWKTRRVRGYPSLAEAGLRLSEALYGTGVLVETTTFPYHLEATRAATVACDRVLLQVYSTHTRIDGTKVPWTGATFSPGEFQRWGIRRLREHRPQVEAAAGLAAWKQAHSRWPVSAEDAMARAYGATVAEGVTLARWWSSKQLVRGPRYGARFLRELAACAPQPLTASASASLT